MYSSSSILVQSISICRYSISVDLELCELAVNESIDRRHFSIELTKNLIVGKWGWACFADKGLLFVHWLCSAIEMSPAVPKPTEYNMFLVTVQWPLTRKCALESIILYVICSLQYGAVKSYLMALKTFQCVKNISFSMCMRACDVIYGNQNIQTAGLK